MKKRKPVSFGGVKIGTKGKARIVVVGNLPKGAKVFYKGKYLPLGGCDIMSDGTVRVWKPSKVKRTLSK
jgi:hypothetical protein